MSSAIISTPEDLSLPRGVPDRPDLREVMLHHRVEALRAITLSLLTELESLGRSPAPPLKEKLSLEDEVKQFEIALIRAALDKARGNQARAARMLGVKHTTLNAKIKRYQIPQSSRDFDAPLLTEQQEIAA